MQNKQKSCKKWGPLCLQENTHSKPALLLSKALWSKRRKGKLLFSQKVQALLTTRRETVPAALPHKAASAVSTGLGSAGCAVGRWLTLAAHTLALLPVWLRQDCPFLILAIPSLTSRGNFCFWCLDFSHAAFNLLTKPFGLQQAFLGQLNCCSSNLKWADHIWQKPLSVMTSFISSLPNISYAKSTFVPLYTEN